MLKAITFDLWNTIFENKSYSNERQAILKNFLNERNIIVTSEALRTAYGSNFNFRFPEEEPNDHSHVYTRTRLLLMFSRLNIDLCEADIVFLDRKFETVALKDPPKLKLGVADTLEILHRDYKLGLISDTGITPGKEIKKIFEKYRILRYFDSLIFSDETGVYKPHLEAFKAALEPLGCLPQDAIHVGDLLETDIKGAKNFGMKTIWITETEGYDNSLLKPDYVINQVPEVIDIVKSIS